MKHYSCLQSISYDVIILVRYSQCQGNNLTIFEGLISGCLGFEKRINIRTCHIISSKTLLGLPSSRLSELSSLFKLMIIFMILSNLLVLKMSLRESRICDFSSIPISEISSISIYTSLFNTILLARFE